MNFPDLLRILKRLFKKEDTRLTLLLLEILEEVELILLLLLLIGLLEFLVVILGDLKFKVDDIGLRMEFLILILISGFGLGGEGGELKISNKGEIDEGGEIILVLEKLLREELNRIGVVVLIGGD